MTDADPFAQFVENTAGELVAQGFPRMPANVIMALTASEEGRLTAGELAERLGVSPAAVSGAVRYLTTVGMVRSSTIPGTRRHVYALPERAWYTASLTRRDVYGHIVQQLRRDIARLPHGAARERIEEMAEFFEFIDRRMPELLVEWEALRGRLTSR
jgi:DNA-binding transcriptional regulator GbsR (MarR family)